MSAVEHSVNGVTDADAASSVSQPVARRLWPPLPWAEPLSQADVAGLLGIRSELQQQWDWITATRARLEAAEAGPVVRVSKLRMPMRAAEPAKRGRRFTAKGRRELRVRLTRLRESPEGRWAEAFSGLLGEFWSQIDAVGTALRGVFADMTDDQLNRLLPCLLFWADVRTIVPAGIFKSVALHVELYLLGTILWADDPQAAYRSLRDGFALLFEAYDEQERRRLEPKPAPRREYAPELEAEGLGSRLLRLYDGSITPKELNELLKAARPKMPDGRPWTLPGAGQDETRDWVQQRLLEHFIPKQIRECGSLEAAVKLRRGRGIPQWGRWQLMSAYREHGRQESPKRRIRLGDPNLLRDFLWLGPDVTADVVWDRFHDASPRPTKSEEGVLGYVLDGLSNRQVAVTMGWRPTSEGYVRRIVKKLIALGILDPWYQSNRMRQED